MPNKIKLTLAPELPVVRELELFTRCIYKSRNILSVMVLVDYSDSDDETGDYGPPNNSINGQDTTAFIKPIPDITTKRPPPPILPSTFTTLYASSTRSSTTDDPALHGGRQRQIPHIAGNWPSFIYLEWVPSGTDLASLDAVIDKAGSQLQSKATSTSTSTSTPASDSTDNGTKYTSLLHSSIRSDLGVRQPLHISLSAPLMLKTDNKDSFSRDLEKVLQSSQVTPFRAIPAGVKWVHNFNRTRYFLIVTLQRSEDDQLLRLLGRCNMVAAQYGMPQLYTAGTATGVGVPGQKGGVGSDAAVPLRDIDPGTADSETYDKFHISIAWTLCEPANFHDVQTDLSVGVEHLDIRFEDLFLKIGSQVTAIPLNNIL